MGTYQKIFHYQRSLLLFFYVLFCLLLVYPIILVLQKFGIENVAFIILIPFVFIVLCALAGSYLYVISYIPLKLVDAFDEVRNKIASGEIHTVSQFANHINKFTVDFFSFMFFDIQYSAFAVGDKSNVFLSENLNLEDAGNIDEYWQIGLKQEEIYHAGYKNIGENRVYCIVVPVWFGKEYLGMMLLYIQQKPGKFFSGMIRDYEELFIDDQLLHIVNLNK
jgi:hypothetical protein